MLTIPPKGFSRSVNVNNVQLDAMCDWMEACILFTDDEFSVIDFVDAIIEEQVCEQQNMALQMVDDAFAELRQRYNCVGDSNPFRVDGARLVRTHDWKDATAHSFCVLLSLAKWNSPWARKFGHDYTEQGELFEEVTKEALQIQFTGWTVHKTGWSRSQHDRLGEVVQDVAARLGEKVGDVAYWTNPDANELGLDLLCYRPFPDARVGIPVYLLQCGSGANWDEKLHTPELSVWSKIVQFVVLPGKAFATPFALLDNDFRQKCVLVNGPLLDRYRLLTAARVDGGWVSAALRERLIAWSEPRIVALLRRSE